MSTSQPRRLNYTRRDLQSFHDDVSVYFKEFLTRVKDTSEMNTGRLYLTLFESLIDNLNFSVDQSYLELILETAQQRKNILRIAYALGYSPTSVSPSSADLTYSLQSGVAGPGGYSVPVYTRNQTVTSPLVEFLTTETVVIPEGSSSISVSGVQGIRVTNEVLAAASSGFADQQYSLENAKTPHSLVEVRVDGVLWEKVEDFTSSDEESQHYILQFDEDDYTQVIFGDGEFGYPPDAGSEIKSDYITTAAEQGNVNPEAISRVIGSLASDLLVSNMYRSSGGAASEANDSIKRNAPATRRSRDRAVNDDDYEALATAMEGVYKAFAEHEEGTITHIYLMPEGGGVASSYLTGQVQDLLDSKKVEGALPLVDTLLPSGIRINVNVITKASNIQKSTVKRKIREETLAELVYTELIRGRGFTQSDLSGIYENIDNGKLVDYVDFKVLTRVPRVSKSNAAAPDIDEITIGEDAGYDTYLVTALTTTTFICTKNGAPQTTTGVVATSFSSDNSEITFTLGIAGDTLTVGDTWLFKTSKYADNIVIDSGEFMELQSDAHLLVSVFFPNEYNIKTKSAV